MTKTEFEKIVTEVLNHLPQEFSARLKNVEVVIEDAPPRNGKKCLLMGLYHGSPAGLLPDKITLYKSNIEAVCKDKKELVSEIKKTILHEIGHYFGVSEKRLQELGL